MIKNLLLTGSSDGNKNRVSFGGRFGSVRQSSSTDTAVNRALQGEVKDVFVSEAGNFEIKREVRNSVINIYSPKKVVFGGVGDSDATTRAEVKACGAKVVEECVFITI